MSTQTSHYNLVKPALSDVPDITAMNPNWDTIDATLNTLATKGWAVNVLEAGTDLNDYLTQGIYTFGVAYAPLNQPEGYPNNGWLVVLPWGDAGTNRKQFWFRLGAINTNDYEMYVRTHGHQGGWSTWAKIYTSKDITASLEDINKLSSLTPNRVVVSDANGKINVSPIATTKLNYLANVTSDIQTQLNKKLEIVSASYVGNGTFGADNPTVLTFPFAPKLFCVYQQGTANLFRSANIMMNPQTYMSTNYQQGVAPLNIYNYAKRSADGKTIQWYSTSSAGEQLNAEGENYYYFAIG